MRISDWSSDVCSSDLDAEDRAERLPLLCFRRAPEPGGDQGDEEREEAEREGGERGEAGRGGHADRGASTVMPGLFRHPTIHQRLRSWYVGPRNKSGVTHRRSEEHTSELQSLMRISYAVFCLKKKKTRNTIVDSI